jgi:hypothetical protein
MRILTTRTGLVIGLVCLAPTQVFAAASSYLCAISEVYECAAADGCERADLKDINLSAFITVDVDKKQLSSAGVGEALRTEDIEGVAMTDKAVFLYGTQDEETWNATLSLENGALSGGITSGPSSFAIFGNCMPKP